MIPGLKSRLRSEASVVTMWLLFAASTASMVWLFLTRERPVVFQTYLLADLFGSISDPPVTFFNPFRTRGPEQVGDRFLLQIKSGNTGPLTLPETTATEAARLRDGEQRNPLRKWYLGDQTIGNQTATLTYWVERQEDTGWSPPVTLIVKQKQTGWVVIGYTAAY